MEDKIEIYCRFTKEFNKKVWRAEYSGDTLLSSQNMTHSWKIS